MFTFNQKTVKAINFNGNPVKVLKYNGIVVWQSSRLPEGYLECEYLETGEGHSYIDTKVVYTADHSFEYRAKVYYKILEDGAYRGEGFNGNAVSAIYVWTDKKYFISNLAGQFPICADGDDIVFRKEGDGTTTLTVNGTSKTSTNKTQSTGVPFKLFSVSNVSHSLINGSKNYGCQIYVDDELVRDFVPALDLHTGRPCMYDLVTNQPYYNSGSGEFKFKTIDPLVPSEYTQLEYLESDGDAYIETDLKFGFPVYAVGKMHYLGNAVSSNNSVFSPFGSSVTSAYFGIDGTDYWSLGNNVKVSIPYNEILEFQYTKATTSGAAKLTDQNGTSATRSGTLSVANINNMYLFRAGWNSAHDTLSGIKKMRTYYVNVYDNNKSCRLVPVKRNSDNELGMYDLVGGKFYSNANTTGQFIGGPEI